MPTFFDTNILVYIFDADAADKQRVARELWRTESAAARAVLSAQVLQEFYVTVSRKLVRPLAAEAAERAVRGFAAHLVVPIDAPLVLAAIRRTQRLQFSLWDALIIEAAITAGATRLWTEDLQHGQRIDGLEVVNPFRDIAAVG